MIYKRETSLRTVTNALAWIEVVCKHEGMLGLTNTHTVSEYFFGRFLSTVNDLNLVNMNDWKLNYPAIDLADAKVRTAYQVTSDKKPTKIQHTLDTFRTHKLDLPKQYDTLRILILRDRQKTYKTVKVHKSLTFDTAKDIIGLPELRDQLNKLTTPKLDKLVDIVLEEMAFGPQLSKAQQHSDAEALELYRRHFDRPFMQDDWRGERNFGDFKLRMEQSIRLLNSGCIDDNEITKSRHDCDTVLSQQLEQVYHLVRKVLQEFQRRVNSNEIDVDANWCKFASEATNDLFNAMRQEITDHLTVTFKAA